MRYFINENLDCLSPDLEVSESFFNLFKRYCRARKNNSWIQVYGNSYPNVPDDSIVLIQVSVFKNPKL